MNFFSRENFKVEKESTFSKKKEGKHCFLIQLNKINLEK
jgi:hypothetical protein